MIVRFKHFRDNLNSVVVIRPGCEFPLELLSFISKINFIKK